ncbi:MAG: cation transporter [Lentisphaeria bacterium]|nr:cation transporter [Lentisphaeria bacterium]
MMTDFLLRRFAPDAGRQQTGILCGAVGIAANLIICAVKLVLGVFAGSVALAADAMNNLSDAGGGVVTLIGFKMAARPADDGHPFGHGRSEYIAGVVLAVLVLAIGLDFLKESIVRLLHPAAVTVSWVGIALLAGTIAVKVWLFFFFRTAGRRTGSPVLAASALDSLCDAGVTSVVLLSLLTGSVTAFPVDGCMGILVAAMILYSGGRVLKDTVDPLLGTVPGREMVEELKGRILSQPEIIGVHDIMIHCYGPDRFFASAHAEVDSAGSPLDMHDVLEAAEIEVARHMPVRLVLHCDPFQSDDPFVKNWRARAEDLVQKIDPVLKLYDFRVVVKEGPQLSFHLLIPRDFRLSENELKVILLTGLQRFSPQVTLDILFVNSFV